MTKNYSVKGCLVQDHVDHWGYNCTNQKDAIKLCEKLNNYEKELQQLRTFEKNFKEVSKQLKEVIMSLKILQDDMEKLKQKIDIME